MSDQNNDQNQIRTSDEEKNKTKKNQRKNQLTGNQQSQPKHKKIKDAEKKKKKMKDYNGKAYESFSCYKLCHKIFLEDIKTIDADNINSNKEFELDEIIKEIITRGYNLEYKDINEFGKIQNQLYNEYTKLKKVNKKLSEILKLSKKAKNKSGESSSEFESEKSEKNEKNDQVNTIKKMEFDLVLKDINGKYINNYLKKIKDDNYQYINSFKIENTQNYNLCFEITFSSKDVLSKKIPQVLKYAVFLNFLYNTNDILKSLAKQKNKVLNENKQLESLKNFFNDKFKFIDLTKKTLLFIVSNGDKKDFEDMIKSLKNPKDILLLDDLNKECSKKYNLYLNYSPFDPEKLKEEIINSINKKEEDNKNQIEEENISKTNSKEFKKILDKIGELEEDNKRIREDNKKMREDYNNIKRDNKEKDNTIKQMQEKMNQLEQELKTIKKEKKGNEENIKKSEEKKDDEKKENGE